MRLKRQSAINRTMTFVHVSRSGWTRNVGLRSSPLRNYQFSIANAGERSVGSRFGMTTCPSRRRGCQLQAAARTSSLSRIGTHVAGLPQPIQLAGDRPMSTTSQPRRGRQEEHLGRMWAVRWSEASSCRLESATRQLFNLPMPDQGPRGCNKEGSEAQMFSPAVLA